MIKPSLASHALVLSIALLTTTGAARQATNSKPDDLTSTFQALEQSLMDAVAIGDKAAWDRAMDVSCIVTSEEGEVMTKAAFLKALAPLPPGLKGSIVVRELTVQPFPAFAVVRFLADESEDVFAQHLTTKYRMTDTFRREGSTWKMVASATAVVTANPPAQKVDTSGWPGLAGDYQLEPNGWTFHVVLKDGALVGGRDVARLRALIPITATAFVLTDSLGEWLFDVGRDGKATAIVNLRKFETLVWKRVR